MKIMIYGGKVIYVTDPDEANLTPGDVALGVSRVKRPMSNGAQSVCGHSLFCYDMAEYYGYSDEQKLACLLHDAHEMFTGDIPTQFKGSAIRKLQKRIDEIVCLSMGLPRGFLLQHKVPTKHVDTVALSVEGGYFYGDRFLKGFCLVECEDYAIKKMFFRRLTPSASEAMSFQAILSGLLYKVNNG